MRIFFLISIFFSFLLAIEPIKSDFKPCFEKYRNSFVKIGGHKGVVVAKNRAILFSKKRLKGYVKYDPFLKLYLFKIKKRGKIVKFTPFKQLRVPQKIAIISSNGYNTDRITTKGDSFLGGNFLTYGAEKNSLISTVCCKIFGLTTDSGYFIDSDYIKKFLNSKKIVYGDIGIKAVKYKNKILVKGVNPFFKNLKVKCGDEIISIDGKKFKKIKFLKKNILFLKPGKIVKIKIKRGGKIFTFKIKVRKYMGGESLENTYLTTAGMKIDKKLRVVFIENNSLFKKLGIKKGDKLMKIGDKYINSLADVNRALACLKRGVIYMLFSRDDFQFFIHFRR